MASGADALLEGGAAAALPSPPRITLERSGSGATVAACLSSAVIGGLSYAAFENVRLEWLAWFWMVPLLLAIRTIQSLRAATAFWGATMFVLFSIGTWWTAHVSLAGALGTFLLGAAVFTVPLLLLHPIRLALGWSRAIWSLPVIWTAWEWAYLQTEGSIGWMQLSVNQSAFYWLVQYVELTGAHGVTFWLILMNVAIAFMLSVRAEQGIGRRFRISAAVVGLILAVPLAYSLLVLRGAPTDLPSTLSVLSVQTSVRPEHKWAPELRDRVIEKVVDTTDRAFLAGVSPDLIVWPEQSIPTVIRTETRVRQFLEQAVADWNAPLIFGAPDVITAADGRPRQRIGSFIMAPADKGRATLGEAYHKQILLPFVERVPYAESVAALLKFQLPQRVREQWQPGEEAKLLPIPLAGGVTALAAVQICYEQLYPASAAEMVRAGGQVLVFPSNDAWYGRTYGSRVIARAARLRAIETRRAIVRTSNSGVTHFVDPYGRIYGELPTWQDAWLVREVALSSSITPFVRNPHLLPLACWVLLVALLAWSVVVPRRQ